MKISRGAALPRHAGAGRMTVQRVWLTNEDNGGLRTLLIQGSMQPNLIKPLISHRLKPALSLLKRASTDRGIQQPAKWFKRAAQLLVTIALALVVAASSASAQEQHAPENLI